MSKCVKCGSYAFNLYKEDIDQGGLCDVHYWQYRAHRAEALAEQPAQDDPDLQDKDPELVEQPAQQEPVIAQNGDTLEIETILYTSPQPAQQDIPDLIAGALGVSRATAYDMMREALAEQSAQQEPENGLRPQDIRVEMYPPQPTSGMVVGMSKGVRLIHTPTGTIVECDTERSQHRNREVALKKLNKALAEQPEFIKHEVRTADDWSEWVCPDPKGYLMKCCDCGLVHEAEFGVVRYKSETEREDCDMVKDPNLQAVFRMRRSEQWTPKDTAYRPGGLAQPEQEPTKAAELVDALIAKYSDKLFDSVGPHDAAKFEEDCNHIKQTLAEQPAQPQESAVSGEALKGRVCGYTPGMSRVELQLPEGTLIAGWLELGEAVYIAPQPAQHTWVGLTDREIDELWMSHYDDFGNPLSATGYERAIEAKLKEKNNG